MPELPEVETVARQLAPFLEGREARALRIFDSRLRSGPLPRLRGRRVVSVGRSGKQVLIGFSSSSNGARPVWLAVHLRMTGRLIWSDAGGRVERDHLRGRIEFDRGWLLFYDTRRFGTWSWYASREAAAPAGIDPLSPGLSAARFEKLIGASRQSVKAWLMRQDRLVGLGNIYASEILHAARVSPLRDTGSIATAEARRLHGATRRILRRAIERCGTTFSDFQDARGVTGSYQRFLRVYGRAGERCPRCGARIERIVQQQRSTFFCPGCQH
jgi:formamidopyrimidine-DNA glycosylase